MEHPFLWVTLLLGLRPDFELIKGFPLVVQNIQWSGLLNMLFSSAILLTFVFIARGKLVGNADDVLPDGRFTLANFFEGLMGFLLGLMKDIIGPQYRKYVPLVIGIWFYVLFANLFGLMPYFEPGTNKWSITISMALVVFFATHIYGIKTSGIRYFTHFLSPIWPPNVLFIIMMPLYLVIELIGHFARVLSLSIRLMANMMADHTVVGIFFMLTPWLIPVIFTGMGLIVCFMQAFIFAILSTIYFALATAHEGHDEEHEAHGHEGAHAEPAAAH
jgi:F-type H+-transporting ATPase subunit a